MNPSNLQVSSPRLAVLACFQRGSPLVIQRAPRIFIQVVVLNCSWYVSVEVEYLITTVVVVRYVMHFPK